MTVSELIERLVEAVVATPIECATEGCGAPASTHFVRGGVGSYYCASCYLKIQAIRHATHPRTSEPTEVEALTEALREAVGRLYSCRYSELPLAKKLDEVLKLTTGQSYHEAQVAALAAAKRART